MSHTPGPWTVTDAAWDADGDVSYTLTGIKEACAADARLIAAAPDLMEALKALVDLFGLRDPFDDDDALQPPDDQEGEIRAAMLAIAKAEGRS